MFEYTPARIHRSKLNIRISIAYFLEADTDFWIFVQGGA